MRVLFLCAVITVSALLVRKKAVSPAKTAETVITAAPILMRVLFLCARDFLAAASAGLSVSVSDRGTNPDRFLPAPTILTLGTLLILCPLSTLFSVLPHCPLALCHYSVSLL